MQVDVTILFAMHVRYVIQWSNELLKVSVSIRTRTYFRRVAIRDLQEIFFAMILCI